MKNLELSQRESIVLESTIFEKQQMLLSQIGKSKESQPYKEREQRKFWTDEFDILNELRKRIS